MFAMMCACLSHVYLGVCASKIVKSGLAMSDSECNSREKNVRRFTLLVDLDIENMVEKLRYNTTSTTVKRRWFRNLFVLLETMMFSEVAC